MDDQSTSGAIVLLSIYFIPTVIAMMRGKSAGSVMVINLFLGWTILFWVIALAMSMGDKR